ncbi:hypothetical protein [Kiritimatiella glycovorans]|uniref:Transglutaminase-like domain-containing protein n=1 Tax=Kiritimatiella glycovorans TaxID=1307763 RepID=A0A0G3EGS5_9BACT|nr:hypothetical protein [Kiritimatiella glycovorans]AKJ65558.1 hypothetical protein L21SP4_02332 [Kiritimatiella glycovorans]
MRTKIVQGRVALSGLMLIAGALASPGMPSSEAVRQGVVDFLPRERREAGIEKMSRFVASAFAERSRPGRTELERAAVIADAVELLRLLEDHEVPRDVPAWVLAEESRLRSLAGLVSEHDDRGRMWEIITRLYRHDPDRRDSFDRLIFAMAVVWDRTDRTPIHHQMGPRPPEYEARVAERYDYFRDLYASGGAEQNYADLSARDLVFVVDTPVPLEELYWARDRVEGRASKWGEKFHQISYDHDRLEAEQYDWPHGRYALDDIWRRGGICVDQAFFAVMTARAHGIPAIYFNAMGRSGGHAWFSYMKRPEEWELDVGRYENQFYTTGYAVDPQTDLRMKDHEIAYTCEHELHTDKFTWARRCSQVAELLVREDERGAALGLARRARELVDRYERPWDIELEILRERGDLDELQETLAAKAEAFRKYTDTYVEAVRARAGVLRETGGHERARELIRMLLSRVSDDGRDDLTRELGLELVRHTAARVGPVRAREDLEKMLEDQVEQGSKVFPLIEAYLKLTKESDQARAAFDFLIDYAAELREESELIAAYDRRLDRLIDRARENLSGAASRPE